MRSYMKIVLLAALLVNTGCGKKHDDKADTILVDGIKVTNHIMPCRYQRFMLVCESETMRCQGSTNHLVCKAKGQYRR